MSNTLTRSAVDHEFETSSLIGHTRPNFVEQNIWIRSKFVVEVHVNLLFYFYLCNYEISHQFHQYQQNKQ